MQLLLHRLGGHERLQTEEAFLVNTFFLTVRFLLVEFAPEIFADRQGEGRIGAGGVNILADEIHFFPEPFVEVGSEIVQSERLPVIGRGGILLACARRE